MKHLRLTGELQERASIYAAGAMTEGERQEFVRHLEEDDCEVCRLEVREFEAAANLLAFSMPAVEPSPSVKTRLMRQAKADIAEARRPVPIPSRRSRWPVWAAGLSAVAASLLLIVALQNNAALRELADSLSARVSQLETQLGEQRMLVATLTSLDSRVVNLAGQGPTPGARARIFWDQSQQQWLFYARDLPPVASDRTYQLWFVPKSGDPVNAKVFNTDTAGFSTIQIPVPDSLPELAAAAVTVEPAGGLPQPSGPFALLGTLE